MTLQLEDPELLRTRGWIAGTEIDSARRFPVVDPASMSTIATIGDLDANDAVAAIAAARAAQRAWSCTSVAERTDHIERWATLIDDNVDDLGHIITAESGKPLREARGEAGQCAALLRWFAERACELQRVTLPALESGQQNSTIRQPVGVVACITPWNFPAAAVIVKAGAAIAAGCAAIVKPSDETPLIALALARLADRAGIPGGVLNVLPCQDPAAIGAALCDSPDVRMLSFTGSTAVGKHLYAACGATVKRLALELGGNAPFIVFADAELDAAVDGAMGARFYNSGQICVGANRFLVEDGIYAEFADRLTARVQALKVGDGRDAASDIGPMINRAAIDRLQRIVASSTDMGARLLAGGERQDRDSLFFSPTVLADMEPGMPAWQTEIFGPVACLYSFATEAEALELANDTQAGLAAYVYTSNRERLERCTENLEAGVVGANSAMIFANNLPFGGIKQSGIGREHGVDCLDEYLELKSVCRGA